jgi:hypothetical protein
MNITEWLGMIGYGLLAVECLYFSWPPTESGIRHHVVWSWSFWLGTFTPEWPWSFWLLVLGTAPYWTRKTIRDALHWDPKIVAEIARRDLERRETRRGRMIEG